MPLFSLEFALTALWGSHGALGSGSSGYPAASEGGGMRMMALVLTAGIAFGQPALWQGHMDEGDTCAGAGRYKEARAAYQLALEDEAQPSDTGFRQAAAKNSLALVDVHLRLYDESRQLYRQALAWFERSRGAAHPEYASVLHNFAILNYEEGRLDEAVRGFHRALKVREERLGENDPATAQTLNSLSAVYVAQGRYLEADRLCRRALAIEEQSLGPEHPQISATLDNLASISLRRRQLEPALTQSQRAEKIARNAFGDRHPITCRRAGKLAVLYGKLGQLEEAETILRRTLEVQLELLGDDSPDAASTLTNLAAVSFMRQRTEDAAAFYRRASLILERSRSDDPLLVKVLSNYAWVLRKTGRKGEARKLETRARALTVSQERNWSRYTVDISDLLPLH